MIKMAKFQPPTPEEVTDYAKSIGFELDGEAFCDHYKVRGWKPKGYRTQMSDWKAAVRTWKRFAGKNKITKKTKLYPISGKTCSDTGCGQPAVYRYTGGQYDRYACSDHLPAKVKERFE